MVTQPLSTSSALNEWGKKGREMQTPLEAQSTEIIIHIISVHSPLANPNMKSHSEATDTEKYSWTAT